VPKDWRLAEVDLKTAKRIAKSLELPLAVSKILVARGLTTVKSARAWLDPGLDDLESPKHMKGLTAAAARLSRAARECEKIAVHGDFDVDGITATAVLMNMLDAMGADAIAVIPHRRKDGYGLSGETVRRLADEGVRLLVTVDCGISNFAETALAKELGLEVIIVDHHEPPEELPAADVIVNPKQPGCSYKFKELAAVGIVFRLAQILGDEADLAETALAQLDLTALGTVADVVPLVGENRALVAQGLKRLREARRPGLTELMDVSGLDGVRVSAGQLGFALAPRLNAAGRLKSADAGLELLRANDPAVARRIAGELDNLNRERRRIEERMMVEAVEMVEERELGSTIVLASPDWHDGVKGIVASRLVERFARPTILFTVKDGVYSGSARSIPALDIHQALGDCAGLLERWGGHKAAAGMAVAAENWEAFRERFEAVVSESLSEADFIETLAVDLELSSDDIDERFIEELERLAPFGKGNPTPVFSLRNIAADDYRELSGGRHLRFLAQAGGLVSEAVAFRIDPEGVLSGREPALDLALNLGVREFRGRSELQLKVIDARLPTDDGLNRDGEARVDVPPADSSYFLPGEGEEVPSVTRLAYIDDRGREERDGRLIDLLELSGSVAVYTRDAFGGVQLAKRLERLGLPPRSRLSIVCGPGDAGADIGRLAFYEAPLSLRALTALARSVKAPASRRLVHLLFGEADLARARETLETLCPSRERLAEIFRALRDNGPFDLDEGAARVRERLGDSIYQPATRQATGRAIKVLAEARLLERDEEGCFEIRGGAVKTDLDASPSWRLIRRQRDEFEAFARLALSAPLQDFPS